MFDETLQRLRERWKTAFGEYAGSRAEAEQAVVRWEWTTGERYSPLPFHFVRFPGRGRVLKAPPDTVGSFRQYGFDAQDRVRLQWKYAYKNNYAPTWANLWAFLEAHPRRVGLSKDLFSQTCYHYLPDGLEIIEYSAPPHSPIPLSVQQIYLEQGKVTLYAALRLNGYTPLYSEKGADPDALYAWLGPNGRFIAIEAYLYEADRLKTISGYYETPGLDRYTAQEQFGYDAAGRLVSIERVDGDGQTQVIFRKRKKGQTFQAIRAQAIEKLVEAVTQRVCAAQIREKIYCIQLSYNKYAEHFPPCLIITPERYRQNMLQSPDPMDRASIFCPIFEKDWFYIIDDAETLALCQALEQEIRAGERWEDATGILRAVAARLTRQDWTNILDTTPDFVVFALDSELEGQDIAAVLKSSVSEQQVQDWLDQGWL